MQKKRGFSAREGLLVFLVLLFFGQAPAVHAADTATYTETVDYSRKEAWISLGGNGDKAVDIFMVYPTLTQSARAEDIPWIRMNNTDMGRLATGWLSVYEGLGKDVANIYMPLYRQLNGALLESLDSETFLSYTNSIPRADIYNAFSWYLEKINKGKRPFILLGHSQGGQLVIELATAFLGSKKNEKYNKNLIAAYAIGVSVTPEQLDRNPHVRFSRSKNDTGVVLSWNTTAPSEIASGAIRGFGTWRPGALVTNPLTWQTDEMLVHAAANKGSLIMQKDGTAKLVPHLVNALVDKEHFVLVTTTVDEAAYNRNSTKIGKFHRCDIDFFYESVRRNIRQRIESFQKKEAR